jgi:hypothetical protein
VEHEVSVRTTRFEDRGIGPGGSDYLGWIHEVRVLDTTFWIRQYEDEIERMDFLEWDRETPGEGHSIRGGIPYADPAFAAAARWALSLPGVRKVCALASDPEYPDESYPPVDPTRLGAPE